MRNVNYFLRAVLIQMALFLFVLPINAGKRDVLRVKVGDTFTVQTTYHSYTHSVLWDWDTNLLELQGSLSGASTSATFKVTKPISVYKTIITAVTYYYKDGTTSSGFNKEEDVFNVYIEDDGSGNGGDGGGTGGGNTGGGNLTVKIDNYDKSNIYMEVGEQKTLTATVTSWKYMDGVVWESTNPDVASIRFDTGVLTANSVGEATIECHAYDNYDVYTTCTVKVSESTTQSDLPTRITLPKTMAIELGQHEVITATVFPEDAKTYFDWSSDNPDIVGVLDNPSYPETIIYGASLGTTNIKVKTNNNLEAVCEVTVKKTVIPATDIAIGDDRKAKFGARFQLAAELTPSNSTSEVDWESSDENVAKISTDGFVCCVGEGTAKITATTDNGLKATCDIKVFAKPTHFVVELTSGERLIYDLNNKTKVVQGKDAITIADGITTLEFQRKEVNKYLFGVGKDYEAVFGESTGINTPKKDDENIKLSGGTLYLTGGKAYGPVYVYNLNGVLINKYTATTEGTLSIPTHIYPTGFYVIKTQNKSIKFIKR